MIKPSQFEIKRELADDDGRLTLAGELDIATVPLLKQEAQALLAQSAKHPLSDDHGLP